MGSYLLYKHLKYNWLFQNIKGSFLGAHVIGLIIYWGLFWGPLFARKAEWLKIAGHQTPK